MFFREKSEPRSQSHSRAFTPRHVSCVLRTVPARRAPQQGRVGEQRDLLFISGTSCRVRQAIASHRIASHLSRRLLLVSLTANTRCAAVHVLAQPMSCAAVLLAACAPLPQGTAVLFCTPRTPAKQAHCRPDPALTQQSLPDHAHLHRQGPPKQAD